jgi:hypothetical protein
VGGRRGMHTAFGGKGPLGKCQLTKKTKKEMEGWHYVGFQRGSL